LAPVVEVLEPDLLYTELDLFETVVSHHISNEVDVVFVVLFSRFGLFVEELTEIFAYGQVDENALVEGHVVVTIDGLHVLELGEVTEGVSKFE